MIKQGHELIRPRSGPGTQDRWLYFDRALKGALEGALGGALELVAPSCCVFCSSPCGGGHLCVRCNALIPRNTLGCRLCASPMQSCLARICARCQVEAPPFDLAVAPLLYDFPVDTAIKALKFRRQLFHLPILGELMYDAFEEHFTAVDGLVAVPLHRWRHALRGFNQAHELCKYLKRRTGLPIVDNVRRSRPTRTQSGLSAEARRQNLRSAFAVRGPLQSSCPLIIDDVMTTGETCRALATELLSQGAKKVCVLTIARARPAD